MCIGLHKIRPEELLMYRVTLHKMRYSALASSNFLRRRETTLVPGVTIFEKKLLKRTT
jgi:hypothetical protein